MTSWQHTSFGPRPHASSLSALRRWLFGLSPVTWSAQLSVSLTRFSVHVFRGLTAPVPNPRRWTPPRPLLLVACRGINLVNSISAKEISAALRLGRVHCFGRESEEVFSCGMYEDCLVSDEDADQGSAAAEAEREEEERRRSEDFSVKCQVRLTRTTASQRQLYLQLSLAPIRISWDEVGCTLSYLTSS